MNDLLRKASQDMFVHAELDGHQYLYKLAKDNTNQWYVSERIEVSILGGIEKALGEHYGYSNAFMTAEDLPKGASTLGALIQGLENQPYNFERGYVISEKGNAISLKLSVDRLEASYDAEQRMRRKDEYFATDIRTYVDNIVISKPTVKNFFLLGAKAAGFEILFQNQGEGTRTYKMISDMHH